MSRELRAAVAAVTFLTRLPVAGRLAIDRDDVQRAGAYFPLVGAAIGAGAAAVANRAGPDAGVVAGALATGALHLDALADLADAGGAGSRERALEIMRDPTVGAFGATAIVCDLLLKRSALAAVDRGRAVRVGLAAGALSRATPVLLAAALPYARSEGTAGALSRGGGLRATTAAAIALVAAITALGQEGVRLAAVAGGLTLAAAVALDRWLGGVTGDALGASLEVTETALLLVAGRR